MNVHIEDERKLHLTDIYLKNPRFFAEILNKRRDVWFLSPIFDASTVFLQPKQFLHLFAQWHHHIATVVQDDKSPVLTNAQTIPGALCALSLRLPLRTAKLSVMWARRVLLATDAKEPLLERATIASFRWFLYRYACGKKLILSANHFSNDGTSNGSLFTTVCEQILDSTPCNPSLRIWIPKLRSQFAGHSALPGIFFPFQLV